MPTVLLSLQPGESALHHSKIGGMPYFPKDYPPDVFYRPHPQVVHATPWPKDPKTGNELLLLLQLNFEEMPPLPSFPTQGILQLFVNDRHWHELDRGLRVVYHAHIQRDPNALFSDFDVSTDSFRILATSITFHRENEYITPSDYRFNAKFYAPLRSNGLWINYLNLTDNRFHDHPEHGYGRNKIGGYHYSQNYQDPRVAKPGWEDSVLLVQFQDYARLCWGDGGSAQFFIKRNDLEQLNFNDLLFHWDST
jgi:uncharacterized protein YwqG